MTGIKSTPKISLSGFRSLLKSKNDFFKTFHLLKARFINFGYPKKGMNKTHILLICGLSVFCFILLGCQNSYNVDGSKTNVQIQEKYTADFLNAVDSNNTELAKSLIDNADINATYIDRVYSNKTDAKTIKKEKTELGLCGKNGYLYKIS